jgi:Putative  PD-(D/E)XK family member, (DUF4420)
LNAAELDAAWRSLPTPDSTRVLEAVPIAGDQIWAAVDHQGRRHLLLQVPEGSHAPPTTTHGLQVTVARHRVRGAQPAAYLDLTCLSDDVAATFTAVAADIGADASGVSQDERLATVADALSRWQWFWGVEPGGLSQQDALGLFGELWFLYRWAQPSMETIGAWTGPEGARHDFQWPSQSVEVKTTARHASGVVLHRIHNLDQLSDPEQGRLFLFSLRTVRDQLAHNTLPDLVDRIGNHLQGDPRSHDEFARKLGQRGYSPVHRRRYEVPYRVLDECLYAVVPGFPRLTVNSFAAGLPAGISDISYILDMAVCDPWLIATGPEDWPP